MIAIALVGVLMHEVAKTQLQNLVDTIKQDAEVDCFIACNANGIFASAPRLASQVEMLFDSGIELIFLGEQAIARNSGRKELQNSSMPLLRPLNLNEEAPGQGARLITCNTEKIWMLSLADQSAKSLLRPAHEQLDDFFGNKNDTFPVLINVNGQDINYKKALSWKYANEKSTVGIIGTGMNLHCGQPCLCSNGSWYLPDVGAVAPAESIAGIAPQLWWEKNIKRIPAPLVPDNSPLMADYALVFYEEAKAVKVTQNRIKL
jgi:calcineurin-like phosphoesterase